MNDLVVVLFYRYTQVDDPAAAAEEQRALCRKLGLRHGRLRLAKEGINGTLAGTTQSIAAYCAAMDAHPIFGAPPETIDWKTSPCASRSVARPS